MTSSAVVPLVKLLSDDVLKENEEDSRLTNDIRSYILADLAGRNLETEVVEVLQVSSFMDPRFKLKHLNDDEASTAIARVCADSVEILSQPKDDDSPQNENSAASAIDLQPPAKKKEAYFGEFVEMW